jgi:glycerol-3-phosphate cytidylyltransferase
MSKKIVYTPGVFDLFHIGHLNILRRAKLTGDYLIVGVCCDTLVLQTKEKMPAVNENQRAEILRELKCVDEAIVYYNLDQTEMLQVLNASVFVIGEEFGNIGIQEHRKALEYCQDHNIEVIRIKRMPGISTTEIKNAIK